MTKESTPIGGQNQAYGEGFSADELEKLSIDPEDLGLSPDLVIPPSVPLNEPSGGVPSVIDTYPELEEAAELLTKHSGPVAIDTERASGIRYGQRPFLVQIKRGDSPIVLIDPEAFEDLTVINRALSGAEWIIHASSQDLPSLRMVRMHPSRLFDTELAGRIAGLPRVGLGAMTEELLGYALAKEHSAADWSQRPLPTPWLNYAALDVELLVDLRDAVVELLRQQGKLDWALEEFEAICDAPDPEPKSDPWRKTKGIRQVRSPRQLTALRNLWNERDLLARHKDVAPKRLLPDSALIAAAKAMPSSVPQLQRIPGFHAKLIKRESVRWVRAIQEAAREENLVPYSIPSSSPPPIKAWESKRPDSAESLKIAKETMSELAEQYSMPSENLLTPEHLRRLCWEHPYPSEETAIEALRGYGARNWQIDLVAHPLARDLAEDA
ncbi:HRDC domain-containing protein [Kocuria sp. HSID16901]|uniref:HRDC domain-containing protein n=1 Tax=Kocuria sp. HSID16901 TaxID=2419505 RepID=UPI0009E32BEF|nr:HRDC domain-containing protein [Kocuria sp. HSID16901]RUQ22728.1 ribonuclease D [Kocuria sp. HSID16901]